MAFEQRPEYQPIFDALAEQLADRAAKGLPLNINIWDGNHGSHIPLEIFADPRLAEIVRPYGTLVRIHEEVASEAANRLTERYRAASPSEREALVKKIPSKYRAGYHELLDQAVQADGAVNLYYPDPRGEKLEEVFGMPGSGTYPDLLREHGNVGAQCTNITTERYMNSLSPQEQEHATEFLEALAEIALDEGTQGVDTTNIDAEIKRRVDARFGAQSDAVLITKYGLAHFSKETDLDEHFPGISLAVLDTPGAVKMIYRDTGLHNDLPDMVFYRQTNKLVKLNTDEARADFLGVTVDSYRTAPLIDHTEGAQHSSALEFQELAPEVRAKCEAATAHLKPFEAVEVETNESNGLPFATSVKPLEAEQRH